MLAFVRGDKPGGANCFSREATVTPPDRFPPPLSSLGGELLRRRNPLLREA
jgi:hypothetical protein